MEVDRARLNNITCDSPIWNSYLLGACDQPHFHWHSTNSHGLNYGLDPLQHASKEYSISLQEAYRGSLHVTPKDNIAG